VRGVHDMQRLIAFNDFPRDPLALNDSCNAIACRQVGGCHHCLGPYLGPYRGPYLIDIACRQVGGPTRPPATLLVSIDRSHLRPHHDISHAPIVVMPCPSLFACCCLS
jgi:hypothetical protein